MRDIQHVNSNKHEVIAVVAKELNKAKKFADQYSIPHFFNNVDKALHNVAVDVAYISTPHPLHFEEIIQCLKKRVAVLCEKPMAINTRQIQEIIYVSNHYQTFCMEAMWIRFIPSIKKVIELVSSGILGNLNSIYADMSFKAPYDMRNRYFNPQLGGGSLLDLGVYGIYLSVLLLGKPEKIQALAKLTQLKVDESCAWLFQYKEGKYAVMESSFIKTTEQDAFIYGDKGFIKIKAPWIEKSKGIVLHLYEKPDKPQIFECSWEGRGFQYEIEEVANCISQQQTQNIQLDHKTSLLTMQIVDEIRELTGICYK